MAARQSMAKDEGWADCLRLSQAEASPAPGLFQLHACLADDLAGRSQPRSRGAPRRETDSFPCVLRRRLFRDRTLCRPDPARCHLSRTLGTRRSQQLRTAYLCDVATTPGASAGRVRQFRRRADSDRKTPRARNLALLRLPRLRGLCAAALPPNTEG